MTVATKAQYIMRPQPLDDMAPSEAPLLIWGTGTPDGDVEPWKSAKMGSLWIQTNATDDTSPIYVKADEGNDDNDWYKLPLILLTTASVLNITSGGGNAAYFH